MKLFEKNVISIYGEKGKAWLSDLTRIVERLSAHWELFELKPVNNLSYNYVLSGLKDTHPIILKLGLDVNGLEREASALTAFTGFGAVKVLGQKNGALLLDRAVPGVSLKSYFPRRDARAVQIACDVMKRLRRVPMPRKHSFPHIRDWLLALDKDWDIPAHYLEKARKLRNRLLETSANPVLLHGDLHHDNILQNGKCWVMIDPKGLIGEPAYEVAAFIRNPVPELLALEEDAVSIITGRITNFAKTLDLDPGRIRDWCFVQEILSWTWDLEDGVATDYSRRLTKILDDLVITKVKH